MTDAAATLDTAPMLHTAPVVKSSATTFMWTLVSLILVVFAAAAAVFGYAGVIVMAVAGAFAMLAMLVAITLTGL